MNWGMTFDRTAIIVRVTTLAAYRAISLGKTQLVEEYLVTHFSVAEKFRPTDYFHVKLDIAEPLEPP